MKRNRAEWKRGRLLGCVAAEVVEAKLSIVGGDQGHQYVAIDYRASPLISEQTVSNERLKTVSKDRAKAQYLTRYCALKGIGSEADQQREQYLTRYCALNGRRVGGVCSRTVHLM